MATMTRHEQDPRPTADDGAAEILLLEHIHPIAETTLAEFGLRVRRHDGPLTGSSLAALLKGVKIIGIRSKSQVTPDVLDCAPDLLGVGCFCIGTNQVDLTEAGRRGVAVFNSPFSNTRSVAELTIAEVIALHRRLCDKSAEMHSGAWDKSAVNAHEVRGRTLGIVGYGHIGSQVSVIAEALGMRVVYHDIAARLPLGNARPLESLTDLLAATRAREGMARF
jgi:D-3-phosphoglycerate dehydrogenase